MSLRPAPYFIPDGQAICRGHPPEDVRPPPQDDGAMPTVNARSIRSGVTGIACDFLTRYGQRSARVNCRGEGGGSASSHAHRRALAHGPPSSSRPQEDQWPSCLSVRSLDVATRQRVHRPTGCTGRRAPRHVVSSTEGAYASAVFLIRCVTASFDHVARRQSMRTVSNALERARTPRPREIPRRRLAPDTRSIAPVRIRDSEHDPTPRLPSLDDSCKRTHARTLEAGTGTCTGRRRNRSPHLLRTCQSAVGFAVASPQCPRPAPSRAVTVPRGPE